MAFSYPYYGHLSMVARAADLGCEVLVVLAYRHAFGKRLSPFHHRLRMCELALQASGMQDGARVCGIERRIDEGSSAPVYTYIVRLREALPTTPYLLVGPDIAKE